MRIAVVDKERCRSDKCDLVCIRFCPMVRTRREAIRLEEDKAYVAEFICSGCGICVRKCPFDALSIVNLPDELEQDHVHRYGPNEFTLYRLPVPREGRVVGLLGKNAIGKSTVLNILAGNLTPNLGQFEAPLKKDEIVESFSGRPLHDFFDGLYSGDLPVVYKPQYVDQIPKVVQGTVREVLEARDERGVLKDIIGDLEVDHLMERALDVLSGGELQRVAIAAVVIRDAGVYLLDEPSSHLDIYQRINAARVIRGLLDDGRNVVVAEHDLAVLDYLSDEIFLLYGQPNVYGIVSNVHQVREGINIYINGYIPDENVRFRESPIIFHVKPPTSKAGRSRPLLTWTELSKVYDGFDLTVKEGEIGIGEVIGILGKNGIGKTTFVRMLAGVEEPDGGDVIDGDIKVSYKPQYLTDTVEGTVEEVLRRAAGEKYLESWFSAEVIEPLHVRHMLDRDVGVLSGGEIQRVAIAECLSRTADIYLLDEPSAYLDVEERLAVARAIRRITKMSGVTAFVVEHDIVAQDFIADKLMVFSGEAGVNGVGGQPLKLEDGMNAFLGEMQVTFRRDQETKRPRVNKEGSRLDKEQKKAGRYYYA
ncbi:MAG: ribosome biogenesis/translation initiation ATPase RLI [Candidatus Bathyarchaeota archaeon]|nr:MAG: ribosome biogenesis/translation initiation ATPase RLI [Candidatus Bathyarchaeota archaeon]